MPPRKPDEESPSIIDLLIWLWRYPRERETRRRKRLGLCYYCGYDVKGTEGRCPECGRYPLFRKDQVPDWPEIKLDERRDAD